MRNHPCLCVLPHYFGTSVLEQLKNVTILLLDKGTSACTDATVSLCENTSESYYMRMSKINSSLLVSHNGPSPKPPPLPSLLQKVKKLSCQPFFLKPVKEGRARATRKKEEKEGRSPPSWISLHSPLWPPYTLQPTPPRPCWIKKCSVIKGDVRSVDLRGGDDKSEELTHCAAKAAKLGSDLFTLPFPSLSLALSCALARPTARPALQ